MKLGLATNIYYNMGIIEQIRLFKSVGFHSFFTRWDKNIDLYKNEAERCGIFYESVHAPNGNTEKLWRDDEEANVVIAEWIKCVEDCADVNIPIVVLHPFRGIGTTENPSIKGVEHFKRVVDVATRKNVKIAIENVEEENYLFTLLEAFSDCGNIGFCWDSGHERCYNRGKDMLSLYGQRLICTHLNDNKGIRNANGILSATDDLHLLPFDGENDWEKIAMRLVKINYCDTLTFELKKSDYYKFLTVEEYVKEAYDRATRVAKLCAEMRGNNL